jgi:hypothetical protein
MRRVLLLFILIVSFGLFIRLLLRTIRTIFNIVLCRVFTNQLLLCLFMQLSLEITQENCNVKPHQH